MSVVRYGKGHRADPFDSRDYGIERLLVGTVRLPPPSVDLSRYVDEVRDQGTTSSCVGQAFARAIHVRAGVEAIRIPFPSALAIYALAREAEGGIERPHAPLPDQGCYPRNAASAMAKHGVCAESRWPFDVARVHHRVPWDVLRASIDALVTGYYRIGGIGAERCALVRRALAAGYPVPFATLVDRRFEDHDGRGEIGPFVGPSLGGHMTCLIGYRPGAFLGINSWGRGWGQEGLFWITDERIGSSFCLDFYALTVAPRAVW